MGKWCIGIIGFGFVGRAIAHGMYLDYDLRIYDKYGDSPNTLEETVKDSDVIFIAVPTPTIDGEQDLEIVGEVIENIDKLAESRKIIIIKSTVLPGTTRYFAESFKDHDFVFNPEFLTERQARLDFLNPARIVLGGEYKKILNNVEEIYKVKFPHTNIFKTSWEMAELVKYMCNSFFSVKIAFCNEYYDLCQAMGLSYSELKDLFLSDQRITNFHCDVPGIDGKLGFGGKCLPKDTTAMIDFVDKLGIGSNKMLKSAMEVNKKVRR